MDRPDNPGVIAFPPLIWLVNAVISVLVHLFIRGPIMRYSFCLVCGIVFIILAPTLKESCCGYQPVMVARSLSVTIRKRLCFALKKLPRR